MGSHSVVAPPGQARRKRENSPRKKRGREQEKGTNIEIAPVPFSAPGTLRIPNTLAILKGAPHPIAAAVLVDYLVTPQTEDRLAMGSSAQLPLSRVAQHRPRVLSDGPVRWMRVDFESAANHWDTFAPQLIQNFP